MNLCRLVVVVWAVSVSPLLAQAPSLPQPDAPVVPPVSSLFTNLAHDVRWLPSLETAIVLGIGGAASLGSLRHDRGITEHLASSETLDGVLEGGDIIGAGLLQAGAAVATYAVGRLANRPRIAVVGADLVRGQILNAVLTQGIKVSVRRMRPNGGKYSFPSGHASSTFTVAAVLSRHFGWKVAVPAHAVAGYVAASRLQENRHFLSDVVFGAAVGIVAGRTVTIGRRSARFAVSPIASADGAGVALTWIGAR